MRLLSDFTASVERAFGEINPEWESLDGTVICGTHSPENLDINALIKTIKEVRESGKPFLGICFGHQLAAIEYARNVLGVTDANSEELITDSKNFVVRKLPNLAIGLIEGETYWHNYAVIEELLPLWKKADNFITCQYHPEYQSSKDNPHPLLVNFLSTCRPNVG